MKKLSIFCGIALVLAMMVGPAYAVSLGFDVDQDGTVDDPAEVTLYESDTVAIDIYVLDWDPNFEVFGSPIGNLSSVLLWFEWDTGSVELTGYSNTDPAWDTLHFDDSIDGELEMSHLNSGAGFPGPDIYVSTVVLHCIDAPSTGETRVSIRDGNGVLMGISGFGLFNVTDGVGTIIQVECMENTECNDENVCTDDSCDTATYECVFTPLADDTPCDEDGFWCTGTDTCQAGECVAGTSPCLPEDPPNECTDDCVEATHECDVCNATNSLDPCCQDPICEDKDVCVINIKEFYVDGTSGDNVTGDGSEGNPWKTITYALNTIPTLLITLDENNRATINVAASTYDTVMGGGDAETFPLMMIEYISLQGDGYEDTAIDAEQTHNVIEFPKEEDIQNVTLDGFTITGGNNFRGGGLTVLWADPIISNCNITGNTSTDINGGGIYLQRSNATIFNCIISENIAPQQKGGGISCGNESAPHIINCTIANNGAGCDTDEGGGGLSVGYNSSATLINTILWGNYRDCSPDPEPNQILEQAGSVLDITYSCIQGGGFGGAGNTDLDPMFFGTGYHLMYGSSCIDAGTSEGAPEKDIDGNPRYNDCATPNGTGGYYDIGAYEYQGDSDLDGILDDGSQSCIVGDTPCPDGVTEDCDDNCLTTPNGPDGGTCIFEGEPCMSDGECEFGSCNMNQEDNEGDGYGDVCDNCPNHPNGPILGTCVMPYGLSILVLSYREGDPKEFITCTDDVPCTIPGAYCQMSQGDWNENGCGDVCECYADGTGSEGVPDGDVNAFDFGILKQQWGGTCPCQADFNEDGSVNAWDYGILKLQWGLNNCPACP